MACVRWVGQEIGRLDARGGCPCAGWGAGEMVAASRPSARTSVEAGWSREASLHRLRVRAEATVRCAGLQGASSNTVVARTEIEGWVRSPHTQTPDRRTLSSLSTALLSRTSCRGGCRELALESRQLESRPNATERSVLEESAGWGEPILSQSVGWRRSASLHRRC
jgi:hypothetical protein